MIRFLTACFLLLAAVAAAAPVTVYLIPNTHGTVSGWLVDFDVERNTVLNNYLWHLDKVKSDPNYRFAYSEVPNVISLLQFAPERVAEVKRLHAEKRFEFSNGFFVEPDVSLSGGETLVQMGVLGLRWYEDIFGFRPRHCWMIDLTGAHRQMPQIVTGLGMDSVFFNRDNPTKTAAFWWVAPDGTRALALVNRTYGELGGGKPALFTTKAPLNDEQFAEIARLIEAKRDYMPSKTAWFSLTGAGDYSSPPLRESYPSEFLTEWDKRYPDVKLRFSIPSDYVDALKAEVDAGKTRLIDYSGDTFYNWDSFWINMPELKQYYRKDEHLLHAAEALAAAASLDGKTTYPSQDFYYSWVDMLMNMDRNTIWGASAGMVFKDPKHWDAWDRFASVEKQTQGAIESSIRALAGSGTQAALYNPLNWKRSDPVALQLPAGKVLAGVPCEAAGEGSATAVCRPQLGSMGLASFKLKDGRAPALDAVATLPEVIENAYYAARIDPKTGALVSLKAKPSGTELLGGQANAVMAETIKGMKGASPEHFMFSRPKRKMLSMSGAFPATIKVVRGPLSTQIVVTSAFYEGSSLERRMTFYRDHPRIDLDTRVDLHADDVLVTADFPLAADVVERSRGIPFGYSAVKPSSSAEPMPGEEPSSGNAILPCIRWSNYQGATGAGLALLDRGLTGHELNGKVVTLSLVNAVSLYMKRPNEMLRGQGVRNFSYALVPHDGSWQKAGIARMAWEFNAPPVVVGAAGSVKPRSFVETSGNVIVEAVRRVGQQIEVRLVEAEGAKGEAELTVRLPHSGAWLTNMMGEKPERLAAAAGGGSGRYRFPVRPQQIVTVRLDTAAAVAKPVAIREWSALVPEGKRAPLTERLLERGHPGRE
jgi:alpha-mannosidase